MVRRKETAPNPKNAGIDFTHLDDILHGYSVAQFVVKHNLFIPPETYPGTKIENRCVVFPKGATVIEIADLHSQIKSFQDPFKYYLKEQIKHPEYNICFSLFGDYIDALKKKVSGTDPYDIEDALNLIREIIFWRSSLGNRFSAKLGNHELGLVFPGFPTPGSLAHLIYEKLDPLEREKISATFSLMSKTHNGIAESHFGPATLMESLDDLGKVCLSYPEEGDEQPRDKYRAPPRPPNSIINEEHNLNYNQEMEEWRKEIRLWRAETIVGQMLYPLAIKEKIIPEDKEEQDFSEIIEEDFEKASRAASSDGIPVKTWHMGHSATRNIKEIKKNRTVVRHLGQVPGFLDLGYAKVLGTAECRGFDDPDKIVGGKNKYGYIMKIDTGREDNFATLAHPNDPDVEYETWLKDPEASQQNFPEILRGLVCDAAFVRKGFHRKLTENFLSKGYSRMLQKLEDGTLPLEVVVKTIDYFTTDKTANVTDVVLAKEPFLAPLDPLMVTYFNE
jgi:hypothetical protein